MIKVCVELYRVKIESNEVHIWFYSNVPKDQYQIGSKVRVSDNGRNIQFKGIIREVDGNHVVITRKGLIYIGAKGCWVIVIWKNLKHIIKGLFADRVKK